MSESAPIPASVSTGAARERETIWRAHLARAAQRDEEALAAFYDETCSLVYGLAYRILGEAASAEEVTLDVYAQVWRSAGSFDPSRGSVVTWLLTVARSRSIDRLRQSANRSRREEMLDTARDIPSGWAGPEEQASSSEQRKRVRDALALLAPEQRQVIEMGYFEALSHSDIAERLGIPLGTVKTRVRLGMMKLREALA